MFRAVQLYTFLEYCNDSPLGKEVLECGTGINRSLEPLLLRFHEQGYVAHGIEISDERLAAAQEFCERHQMDLDLRKGDMRKIPFEDEAISFIFSYNTIFHMTKQDITSSMQEIERVLKPGGICFVNFLSVDSDSFGEGEEVGRGEFLGLECGRETIHTYHEDNEPDEYFGNFEILHKEKRVWERRIDGEMYTRAYIDYIAKKRSETG
jgi:ubiquinone/menaquinone biosynthesis C-methylase UbiE